MKISRKHLNQIVKNFLFKNELVFATLVFKIFFCLNKNCILTCERTDGGGAQLHGRLSVLAFANFFGVKFLNTPIRNANFANGKDQYSANVSWDTQWNALINFESLSEKSLSKDWQLVKVPTTTGLWKFIIKKIFSLKIKSKYLFVLESAHRYTDLRPKIIGNSRNLFQDMLNPISLKVNEDIVIHLRRGDATQNTVRYTADETIFTALVGLMTKYPNTSIRIYTNEPFDLPKKFYNVVTVDVESSPFEAITHMANCKILVIAKSSMSYIAALMNKNTVYCPNFWHPKMNNWINASELETFKYQLN
jgi:hypothetical protein